MSDATRNRRCSPTGACALFLFLLLSFFFFLLFHPLSLLPDPLINAGVKLLFLIMATLVIAAEHDRSAAIVTWLGWIGRNEPRRERNPFNGDTLFPPSPSTLITARYLFWLVLSRYAEAHTCLSRGRAVVSNRNLCTHVIVDRWQKRTEQFQLYAGGLPTSRLVNCHESRPCVVSRRRHRDLCSLMRFLEKASSARIWLLVDYSYGRFNEIRGNSV